MNAFELLFLAGLLVSIAAVLWAATLALTGQRPRARRLGTRLGIAWAGYVVLVVATAAFSPAREFAPGAPQCFDDMCFAVSAAARQGGHLAVTINVSNRARRVTEGERGLRAQLWVNGRRFEAVSASLPLSVRLPPGGSADSVQEFPLPPANADVGIVLNHGITPGYVVIGESPLLHRPPLMRLRMASPLPGSWTRSSPGAQQLVQPVPKVNHSNTNLHCQPVHNHGREIASGHNQLMVLFSGRVWHFTAGGQGPA